MSQWAKYKVAELKEECKARQISLTGLKLKQQYIDKLVEYENERPNATQEISDIETKTDDNKNPNDNAVTPLAKDDQSGERGHQVDPLKNQPSEVSEGDTTRRTETVLPIAHKHDEMETPEVAMEDTDEVQATTDSDRNNKSDMLVHTKDVQDVDDTQDEATYAKMEQNREPAAATEEETAEARERLTPEAVEDETRAKDPDRKYDSTEYSKRKRKSTSPAAREEEVVKKAKAANGEPIPTKQRPRSPSTQSISARSSKSPRHEEADVNAGTNLQTTKTSPNGRGSSHAQIDGPSTTQPTGTADDSLVEPALHHVTRSLYMRNFKRPINGPALREHIATIAHDTTTLVGDDNVIEFFYMDKLKSHAFFTFPSKSMASKVRSCMHRTRFPDEPIREPLWVDFVPDDVVKDWADQETGNGGDTLGRNSATKYEVVYDRVDNVVVARLQEVGSSTQQRGHPALNARTASQSKLSVRMSSSNADLNRTSAVVPEMSSDHVLKEAASERHHRRPSAVSSSSRKPHADQATGFGALEELFEFTKTKPKLYYKLPSRDTIDDRTDMIRDLYSDRGMSGDPGMKRYTFETHKGRQSWVDDGPEFGHGRRGQEILAGLSRGRGRGGYRSRGAHRPYGTDSYRGGR